MAIRSALLHAQPSPLPLISLCLGFYQSRVISAFAADSFKPREGTFRLHFFLIGA